MESMNGVWKSSQMRSAALTTKPSAVECQKFNCGQHKSRCEAPYLISSFKFTLWASQQSMYQVSRLASMLSQLASSRLATTVGLPRVLLDGRGNSECTKGGAQTGGCPDEACRVRATVNLAIRCSLHTMR